MTDDKSKVLKVIELKDKINKLKEEQLSIEKELPDLVIFENGDNTWTRYIKTDNKKELDENGGYWMSVNVKPYSSEIRVLKNKPKEIK